MLTQEEQDYLDTLSQEKIVHISPYSPQLKEIAEDLMKKVHVLHPELKSFFGGSAGLRISGQNDIDIDFLTVPENFAEYFPTFVTLFGEPRAKNDFVAGWSFEVGGMEVDMWLTDETSESTQTQYAIFHLLQSTPSLLKEYEELKQAFNGKPYRDYQRAKYEFFHRIFPKS